MNFALRRGQNGSVFIFLRRRLAFDSRSWGWFRLALSLGSRCSGGGFGGALSSASAHPDDVLRIGAFRFAIPHDQTNENGDVRDTDDGDVAPETGVA